MNSLTDAPATVQSLATSYPTASSPEYPQTLQPRDSELSRDFSQSSEGNWRQVRGLRDIPADWVLTLVCQKRPLRPDWQKEAPLHRGHIQLQLLEGTALTSSSGQEYIQQWDGFGVRTGSISGGLLGLDVDGPAAEALLATLSGAELPPTPSWASGRPGRRALALRFSDDLQARIETRGGWGGKKLMAAPGQELHFRYDGHQQVLPPSAHPETGRYRWLTSPAEATVAPAPAWLEGLVEGWLEGTVEAVTAPAAVDRDSWPLLPPIKISGPGETNDALRQLANWGYNKLGHREIDALGDYLTENAPKMPGWAEFASHDSRADLSKGWGQRWAKSCCKYWSSPRAQHRKNASEVKWQDWLQTESLGRLQWAIDQVQELGVKSFSSVNQLYKVICELSREQFGKAFSRATIWTVVKELWEGKGDAGEEGPGGVQEVPNRTIPYKQENQGFQGCTGLSKPHPRFTLILPLTFALLATPAPTPAPAPPAPTPQTFRKGDRVVFDDGTGLPYCGQEATVQARVTDDGGNTCYRLNIDYQGRTGTKARKVEALPSFLTPALPTPPSAHPDYLEAPWQVLEAVLGSDANPFVGGDRPWRVTAADIGRAAYRRLRDYLQGQEGATHA